jgi:hypothetical protein
MATRVDRQRARKHYLSAVLALFLAVAPSLSSGENHNVDDIKAFGLLDVSGRFRTTYLFDDRERGSGQSGSFETRSTWEEEFFLLTRSFVYHPGFLNMDIGGGPVFVQQQFDATLGESSDNDTLFNFLARFNFLELKTYPFSLHYERSHPSITTSLAGRFLTESDAYGIDGRIFGLLGGSTSIRFKTESRATQGSSSGRVVDDDSDSASVLIETSYRTSDRLQFKYDLLDTASASGSPGLPIYQSDISQEIVEIRSSNWFGRDDRFEINQVLRRLQQDTEAASTSTLDDRHYLADMRWKIADKTRSYLRYRQYDTRHTFSNSETQDVELGVVRQANEHLSFDSAIEYVSSGQTGFNRDMSTLRGSVNYTQDIGFGTLGLSASLRGSRTDQESSATDIQVFDETHILNGTTPVDLANEFVVTGSVVVSNAARTQVLVEGIDYRLVVTGSVTSIQRLIGGNISDGETIVVDYSYETSGTAEFDSLGAGFSVNIGFLNSMNAYLRYNSQDTNLRSGEFTNPINDRDSIELGVSTTNQFLDGWSLNGQFRHRVQNEEISPFVSDTLDVSLTTNLSGRWKLTVASSLSVVDFENSIEDTNQVSYRLGLSGRLFRRAVFSYDLGYLSDDGGSLQRDQLRHRLKFQWAYRQVRFVLGALIAEDALGISENDNTQVTAQLTRVF